MQQLSAAGLTLEPLTVAHAGEMFAILSDPELYRHLDHGPPPSVRHLRDTYARWERGGPPDGTERWLNWVIRRSDGSCVGHVQATVVAPATAWVAYVLARGVWGRGYARAAVAAVIAHLQQQGTATFLATVAAANRRSITLLRTLSFDEATAAERGPHALAPGELLFIRRIAGTAGPGSP